MITLAAAVDHATHGSQVADLKFADMRPHPGNRSHDLVTWYAGIHGTVPFVSRGMEIRVTDPAVAYFDLDVMGRGLSSWNVQRVERRRGGLRAKSLYLFCDGRLTACCRVCARESPIC